MIPEAYRSPHEDQIRNEFVGTFRECPIPDVEILQNLGLFLSSKNLSRILFMDYLYRQIVDVPGVVLDLGCRWGHNAALFCALRGIYEPFNRMRKVVAFDTFTGFTRLHGADNPNSPLIAEGKFATGPSYVEYLTTVLQYIENDNPMAHIRKFDIRAGDASVELPKYLKEFPETIVALAYFDFDIYQPTLDCLKAIRPHLTRGSVLGFDELNDRDSPGETLALNEVFGLSNIRLKSYHHTSRVSYFVVEE